jgi:transposase
VITDPIQINRAFVQLPDVVVLGVENPEVGPFVVHIELQRTPQGCPDCGVVAYVKDRDLVELVDLALFARPTRLLWHKRRLHCLEAACPKASWTEQDPRIATMNLQMTDRCGKWMTEQVGRCGRPVSDVAHDLGCDWHTVNDAVLRYGEALLADPGRFGDVSYLGLDETAFAREAPYYRTQFTTSIVDVGNAQLLDVVPGRKAEGPTTWLKKQGEGWLQNVQACALDLSGPYRKVFTDTVPQATLVADPFHVIKVRHEALRYRGRVRDPPHRTVAAVR